MPKTGPSAHQKYADFNNRFHNPDLCISGKNNMSSYQTSNFMPETPFKIYS